MAFDNDVRQAVWGKGVSKSSLVNDLAILNSKIGLRYILISTILSKGETEFILADCK
jgi:hypothetical protein